MNFLHSGISKGKINKQSWQGWVQPINSALPFYEQHIQPLVRAIQNMSQSWLAGKQVPPELSSHKPCDSSRGFIQWSCKESVFKAMSYATHMLILRNPIPQSGITNGAHHSI